MYDTQSSWLLSNGPVILWFIAIAAVDFLRLILIANCSIMTETTYEQA